MLSLPHRFANKEVILDLTIDHSIPTEPPLRSIYLCLDFRSPQALREFTQPILQSPALLKCATPYEDLLPFCSAHSPFTRLSKRRKGGQQVPRALCPTHLSRSKCSSPVPPNAPISRQRSCECAVMLRMLRHGIDRLSSPSFPVHSLYISDTQGRTRWEESCPSLCPVDHSAGILHSRLRLTAARECNCRYVSLSGSLAPPLISFYDML